MERDQFRLGAVVFGFMLIFLNVYYFSFETFYRAGLSSPMWTGLAQSLSEALFMRSPYTLKFWALGFLLCVFTVREGKKVQASWGSLLSFLAVGLILYLLPWFCSWLYMLTTLAGFAVTSFAVALIARKISRFRGMDNDLMETFEQCGEKMENDMSVNFPTKYQWKKRIRDGWINVIQPQRGTLILGTPGSGKSFSLYNGFIRQMIDKNFSMMIYDFKMPDLSEVAYNCYLRRYPEAGKGWRPGMRDRDGKPVPQFCVINFDDPRYSMRCNPLHPRYIVDPADASEAAKVLMDNINPQSMINPDFFTKSATEIIADGILTLKTYRGGIYCDFAHLIELFTVPYSQIFELMKLFPEVRARLAPFSEALSSGAMEQLSGQMASAQIPIVSFVSPALYWVLTGDDFTLDLNNPERPKILCIGNNPDRQSIYGTTLALYTSRIFKTINHKGRVPCGVLLDEFPTVRVHGIDNVIATARSNKVCVVLGAQDKSQIVRDYGDKEASVVFNTVGNILSGQVNGNTARDLSASFGREFREQQSQTTGGENETINTSYHQQEILPQSQIEQLSQGTFFGKVADDVSQKISKKLFCAEVQVDMDEWKRMKSHWHRMPRMAAHDFGEKAVRDEVMKDPTGHVKAEIRRRIEREDDARYALDRHYQRLRFTNLDREVDARFGRMTGKERRAMLEEVIQIRERECVDMALDRNFHQIKEDIRDMFAEMGVSMEAQKKNQPTNTQQQ